MPALEKLYSPAQLATYLGKPVATLYAWRYRGDGPPAIPVGRGLRYRESDVIAWLDAQANDSKRSR